MRGTVNERIQALRERMAVRGIDACLIPTDDYHGSENVGDYFKCREYITGFTGSAGTAVITMDEAGLWTDGRYFVQAAGELFGSEVRLFRMGEEGVPSVSDYLYQVLPEKGVLAFDGRVLDVRTGEELQKKLEEKQIAFSADQDLVGEIWTDRPELSKELVWILSERYAGQPACEKLEGLKKAIIEKGAEIHILSSLDEIAWLLNLRGNDISCTPVFLSYLIVTEKRCILFVQQEALSEAVRTYLAELQVEIRDYEAFYKTLAELQNVTVLLEKAKVNYQICKVLDETVSILDEANPASISKAIKNPVEIENMKKAHIKDGVAVTRFLCWLKHAIGKEAIDECSAAACLEAMRAEQEGSLGPSFDTISAYGSNAAMCHYSAEAGAGRRLEAHGLYLVDSGGHYYEGTTDITRTIALGTLTEEEKRCFTLVACSMLRLLDAKFLYGCHGYNLDYAARELLWRRGLDYNHGTGHGVAYLGPVHEGPNSVRWRVTPARPDYTVFEEGMITSNEPGLYFEGKFGIRTENLMLCVKAEKNEYGQFMKFENLTWVPIDLDAIDPGCMEEQDKERLNAYHKNVYEKISPYLSEEEAEWLKQATREI